MTLNIVNPTMFIFVRMFFVFKHIASFCLLGLYLVALLKPIYPFLEYQYNKAYITKEKCINQTVLCSGKCYLNGQIQKNAEDQQKDKVQINLGDYPISLIVNVEWFLNIPKPLSSSAKKTKTLCPILLSDPLLKPPQLNA